MVKVQRKPQQGLVKVTFTFLQPTAQTVHVMGDFNDWRPVNAMERTADGSWRLTMKLTRGREYQYRYLQDGIVWTNDPDATASVANPFGSENSLLAT